MDSFGNYPREKFDPFSVMLFKALQVVAFLFFIALLVMNPEAKSGKIDTKAEFIITLTWPDSHPDDIDLYAEDPVGNIVWYHAREAGFMVLDRDDRGGVVGHVPEAPGGEGRHRHVVFLVGRGRQRIDARRMRERLVLGSQRRGGDVGDHEAAVESGVGREKRRQP